MRELLGVVAGLALSSTIFFFWYHEMFRDGFIGEFSHSFDSGRGKNFTALTQPAFGMFIAGASLMLIAFVATAQSARGTARLNGVWLVWGAFWAAVCLLSLIVALVSFIPFSLPEWMYPEYHAAKREEQRMREAAERGESEDRDPFLDDNGVYASQLGNVPVGIPEAVGLPSTRDPHSPQTAPSAEGLSSLQGAPETGMSTLHNPDATTGSDASTANVFDVTATTAALPRTTPLTSHGARPARASRARRGHGGAATTPTGTREDPNGDA